MLLKKYYSRTISTKSIDKHPLIIYWASDSHVKHEVDGDESAEGAVAIGRYYYTAGQKLQNFVDDVNINRPDLVYVSGDMLEVWHPNSADIFMDKWTQIDPSIKKELTLGNHDLAGAPELANTTIADKFGYGNRPVVAGSKFNQSFYISNIDKSVKIISVDTNINDNGNHTVITAQLLKEPIRNWIKAELLNSTSEKVIICSHGGMADNSAHFNADDQLAFKLMIDEVAGQRPELEMYSIFGHNHRTTISEYATLGENIKCYSMPPAVNGLIGKYAVVIIANDGLSFEIKDLTYPYN